MTHNSKIVMDEKMYSERHEPQNILVYKRRDAR